MPALSPAPIGELRRGGERPALITPDGVIDFIELADRIDDARAQLGSDRRLIALTAPNTVESVVWFTAALTGGHPVALCAGDPTTEFLAAYEPDVVVTDGVMAELREGSRHDLHPNLALLMSTSGSTGSPKTVRLSRRNVEANAASIAEYLELTPDDRALTTLPMHYCYGLSVVTSHLHAGASLAVTDWSVADPCLWDFARDAEITSFAGVPYSFEMLDAGGFAERELPSLRYLTVAGGRMAAPDVARWAALGHERGWQFVAMYGQTEATARMGYLPPHLAESQPHALGIAIPGGTFRIDPVPEAPVGAGELVYVGDNVMMGYAEEAADLARPAELTELRTGDLATREDGGLFVWAGRRKRIAKCFGLRIDLDHVEALLAADGVAARCVERDHGLGVFVTGDVSSAGRRAARATGLPAHAITVTRIAEFPRTANGKVDYQALAEFTADRHTDSGSVRDQFATVLGRPEASGDDTFVSLGGDSLSYVELSVRLGNRGIDLPDGWQHLSIATLDGMASGERRRTVRTDTSILLRALAIVLIVGTHGDLFTVPGGAHLLLAIAGYNFARFGLGTDRVRRGLASIARVALPATAWIAAMALLTGAYSLWTAVFLNGLFGSDDWNYQWRFWFLEALVWIEVGALALVALPVVDRLLRRSPFATVAVATAGALALRFAWVGIEAGPTERYTPGVVLWCFLAGWLVAAADRAWQRLTALGFAAVGTIGFFGDPGREALVLGGIAVLALLPSVRMPRPIVSISAVLASASLYIYVTHWQFYPAYEESAPLLGLAISIAVGVAYWQSWTWGSRTLARYWRTWHSPSRT